jgi:zinc transporter
MSISLTRRCRATSAPAHLATLAGIAALAMHKRFSDARAKLVDSTRPQPPLAQSAGQEHEGMNQPTTLSRIGATADEAGATLDPPALIWGWDFTADHSTILAQVGPAAMSGGEGVFRWLHLNMADQWAQGWVRDAHVLPVEVRDLLLAPDQHPRALVEGAFTACVLPDVERDFEPQPTLRIGALRFVLGPDFMITARFKPQSAADAIRNRIQRGGRPTTPQAAFDLAAGGVAEVIAHSYGELNRVVQDAEDALLDDNRPPSARALAGLRRRSVLLRRQLAGLREVFGRLEEDEDLPPALAETAAKLAQRFAGLDGDVASLQGQVRLLLEELDMRETQRTNQNLYVLSILTALLLPATLVTGVFGMNTGGLPLAHGSHGTIVATVLVVGSSFATYVLMRALGFFRR